MNAWPGGPPLGAIHAQQAALAAQAQAARRARALLLLLR